MGLKNGLPALPAPIIVTLIGSSASASGALATPNKIIAAPPIPNKALVQILMTCSLSRTLLLIRRWS
jgi:hypothetical protein